MSNSDILITKGNGMKKILIILILLNLIQSIVLGYLIIGINEEANEELPFIEGYEITGIREWQRDNEEGRQLNLSITIFNPTNKMYTPESYSITLMTVRRNFQGYAYSQEAPVYYHLRRGRSFPIGVDNVPETFEELSMYIVLFLNGVEIDRELITS